jgi:hypothetical protein
MSGMIDYIVVERVDWALEDIGRASEEVDWRLGTMDSISEMADRISDVMNLHRFLVSLQLRVMLS